MYDVVNNAAPVTFPVCLRVLQKLTIIIRLISLFLIPILKSLSRIGVKVWNNIP